MTENIWDIFQRARKYYNQNSLSSKLHLYVVIVLSNIAERSLELENICNIDFFYCNAITHNSIGPAIHMLVLG